MSMTYPQAVSQCQAIGGSLASFHSDADAEAAFASVNCETNKLLHKAHVKEALSQRR